MGLQPRLNHQHGTLVGATILVCSLVALRLCSWPIFLGAAVLPIMLYGLCGSRTFPLGALAGKTVVVTGASSGIGQAVALSAAARGAKTIVLVARSKDKLDATALAIKNKYESVRPIVLPADASIPNQALNVAKSLSDKGIAVNLLVNCAGRWTLIFLKNTERVYFCWTKMSLPHLVSILCAFMLVYVQW